MTKHIAGHAKQRLDSTRRHFFQEAFGTAAGLGIGSAALMGLMDEELSAQSVTNRILDFAPKAKSVIYLEQCGGPPHVDLFDFKQELVKRNGDPVPESLIKDQRFAF